MNHVWHKLPGECVAQQAALAASKGLSSRLRLRSPESTTGAPDLVFHYDCAERQYLVFQLM